MNGREGGIDLLVKVKVKVKLKVKLVIQVNHRSLLQVGDDCLD